MLGTQPGEITLIKFNTRKGGFTLIELMIVVAIIGILAAIAIPNFLRFQLKAKSSEGKTNLAAIRTAEQSYYSEFGVFVSASASPPNPPQNQKTNFTYVDPAGAGFDRLGWSPEGQVYFNYGVAIANSGYTAAAAADIDADTTYQQWGYKKLNAGANVTAPDLGNGGVCPVTGLATQVVGPCAASFGQSVF
jgi:type IV pilus assembly protein PilA